MVNGFNPEVSVSDDHARQTTAHVMLTWLENFDRYNYCWTTYSKDLTNHIQFHILCKDKGRGFFHCTVVDILWRHLLSTRIQTTKNCMRFVVYNKPKWASDRLNERVFVLRDESRQLRASVLLLITAGSQSETRTVGFCYQERLTNSRCLELLSMFLIIKQASVKGTWHKHY